MSRKNDQKFRITIKNWDEYQRDLQGDGKRRSRRKWIAISVDLFSDPDFLELDHVHARLWLGMLLHAGKVGPVFSLTPARAVAMFCLKRPCDFQVLADQGFIDLQEDTKHTGQTVQTRQTPRLKKPTVKRDEQFEQIKAEYPKRHNSDHRWAKARQYLNARLAEGHTFEEIIAGVIRYRKCCEATGTVRTKWVKQGATFLGTERYFLHEWNPPLTEAEHRTSRNLAAVDQALEETKDERK